MKIIIIGCGQVGKTLTKQLASENHDITIIDRNDRAISPLVEEYDVMGVCGNGASIGTLTEAGVESTDILIAVTESDETNLLCCLMAKKAGRCRTIARVRDPIYNGEIDFIKAQMGISMIINPEQATALEMAQLIKYPSALNIDSFAKGRIQLVKIRVKSDSPLADTEVRDIFAKTGCEILVCAVERNDEVIIPYGSTKILAGDMVSFVAPTDKIRDIFNAFSLAYKPIKNTMIVGGDMIAYYLAKQLIDARIDVKMIEEDLERCEWLDESLPAATVIQGDGTDRHLLLDEGIENAGAFVATTHIDEENIFLAMYAKEVSNAKLISKVNRLAFDNIINRLDIGSVIFPNFITADYIVQYVRACQNSSGSNVSTLCRILNDNVEVVEFTVQEGSAVIGIPLMELDIRNELLVCCICRDERVIIPGGQDCIEKGDSVMIVTLSGGLQDINDILRG